MKNTKSNSKSTTKPSAVSTVKAVKVVRGKTARATMINLLLKNKGKVVAVTALKTAIQKVTGLEPETVESRIKTRTPIVAKFAKQNNLKLVTNSKGFSLVPVKG